MQVPTDPQEDGTTGSADIGTLGGMTSDLVGRLGLTITALSDILDIERAEIYRWMRGEAEARPREIVRLRLLLDAFEGEEPGSLRVFHRHWKRELADGSTLRVLLTMGDLQPGRIGDALDEMRPAVKRAMAEDAARGREIREAPHPADLLSGYLEVGPR